MNLIGKGVNLMPNDLCKLKDARAYIDGLMEEVQEGGPAWEALNGAWCSLNESIASLEEQDR